MRSRRARRHEPVGKAASHQEDGSHAIIAARRKWAMPRRAISLTARCRRSSFHLDAISEVPHASAGHRSSKHERLTPLSRRFSWQLHCERDDPIRTMLPCQHLAFLDACENHGRRLPQQRSRRALQDFFAVQIRTNLLYDPNTKWSGPASPAISTGRVSGPGRDG